MIIEIDKHNEVLCDSISCSRWMSIDFICPHCPFHYIFKEMFEDRFGIKPEEAAFIDDGED